MAKNNKDLMHTTERRDKKGNLSLTFYCSGKDPMTRKNKVYVKTYKVPTALKGVKEIEAFRLQSQLEWQTEVQKISKGIIEKKDYSYLKFIDVANEWVETILARKKEGYTHYRDCKDKMKYFEQQLGAYYLQEVTQPIIRKFCYWLNTRTYQKTVITVIKSLKDYFKENDLKLKHVAKDCGIAHTTLIVAMTVGAKINKETMEKICKYLYIHPNKYFDVVTVDTPYSKKSNDSMKTMLYSILNFAVDNGYINENFASKTDTRFVSGTEGKKVIYESDEEIKKYCNCVAFEKDIRKRVAFTLFINFGLRCCELVALEWGDFNFNNSELHIQRNTIYVIGMGTITKATKNKTSDRVVSFSDSVSKLLKEYKEWWDKEKINHGDLWANTDRLFCQNNGRNMAGSTIAEWLSDFQKQNNLKQVTPHGLRHTYITMLLKNGVDIKTIASRVGHSTPDMIFKVYAHYTKEADKKAANMLEGLLKAG